MDKYSVLMCVYHKDNPEWFDLAIRSMLDQTVKPEEFVIVEDGPITEALQRVIEKHCGQNEGLFHIVKLEKNCGLGEALRVGVENCRNEWIARMDSDDYSVPDRLEKQFQAARRHNADMIGSDVAEFVGEPDKEHVKALRVFPEKHGDLVKFGRRRTMFCHPAILMKRSQVLAAGNYQTAYLHEDFDLFIRMLQDGCIGYTIKETLVYIRVNEDFYRRRGGLVYLKALLRFNWRQLRAGWMKLPDFVARSGGNIVFCLMPNGMRDFLYRKVLRK